MRNTEILLIHNIFDKIPVYFIFYWSRNKVLFGILVKLSWRTRRIWKLTLCSKPSRMAMGAEYIFDFTGARKKFPNG